MNSYFYSGQIRRFLQQFIRLMSNFQVQLGQDRNGTSSLLRVPVFYGDASRQASQILRNNSENTLLGVPAMAIYITGFQYDRSRVQEPFHVSSLNVRERAYNPVTGELSSSQGYILTVERLIPIPYILTLKCDIWTSNTDQKLQLLEQISVLFNPSMEIQSTDNNIDWSSLSYITLTDTSFTSRSVPSGADDQIDIASLTFELPIWLSAPAKVKKMGVIQRIISSVWDDNGIIASDIFDTGNASPLARQIVTIMDFNIIYLGNTLQLIQSNNETTFDPSGVTVEPPAVWELGLARYGYESLRNGISQIRLEQDGITIVGTVAYHPSNASLLLFTPLVDTLPANTLDPVTAIINPLTVSIDSALLTPVIGTRFLILQNIGYPGDAEGPVLWNRPGYPQLLAKANDIIEYDGTHWTVSFNSSTVTTVQYVTNLRTINQYKWKDQQWTKAVEGRYGAGAWTFVP